MNKSVSKNVFVQFHIMQIDERVADTRLTIHAYGTQDTTDYKNTFPNLLTNSDNLSKIKIQYIC